MKNIFTKNNVFKFSCIIIFLLIVLFQTYIYKDITFWREDCTFGFYNKNQNIFSPLFNADVYGGGYIPYFFTKLFTFGLPFLINIHPLDYASIPRGIIIGLFSAFFVFSCAEFIKPLNRSKILYILILLSVAGFLYTEYYALEFRLVEIVNYAFFRYVFSLLIYNLFWFFVFENFIKKRNNIKIKDILIMSVLAFVVCSGLELLMLMSLINIVFLSFFLFFKNKQFFFDKFCFSSFIILTVFSVLWINSPHFHLALHTKISSYPVIDTNYIIEFFKLYNKLYMPCLISYFSLFGLYLLCKIKLRPLKSEFKATVFSLVLQISSILGILSLFFSGKNFAESFYLYHANIIFASRMLIIVPIVILAGCFIKQIREYRERKIVSLFISLIFVVIALFTGITAIKGTPVNIFIVQLRATKKIAYINEKIMRYYYLNKNKPILLNYNGIEIGILGNEISPYSEGECISHNTATDYYYPQIYKDNISKQLGYCVSKDAIFKFYERGGSFTKKEIENIKFKRLKERDFVLKQNNTDTYSAEELNKKVIELTKNRAC